MSMISYFIFISIFFAPLACASPALLHPDEVEALQEIARTLGIKNLDLREDPCAKSILRIADGDLQPGQDSTVICDCSFDNNRTCHITQLTLKTFSLPGRVPPELVKLRYLNQIDLCRNYLSGTIPVEWASMAYLKSISLCSNRLSGNIPSWLGKLTNLTSLVLEENELSGTIPDELGNLINLEHLKLASNRLTGSLPSSLSRLVKLRDFFISDNNLSGNIPDLIGNWFQISRLYLFASGLRGPIPDSLSRLENLKELRISDTTGIDSFPNISSNVIRHLTLRNVNMSGPIPPSIWQKELYTLDVSFNKLTGEVPTTRNPPKYTYLTGNMISGEAGSGVFLTTPSYIDLSYNNFTWSSKCVERSNINTFRSSNMKNNLYVNGSILDIRAYLYFLLLCGDTKGFHVTRANVVPTYSDHMLHRTGLLPCADRINCRKYHRSVHINCGGENVDVANASGRVIFQGDNSAQTTAATNHHWENWGFSNTGDFINDKFKEDSYVIATNASLSGDSSGLYKTARRSALSLVYYAFCLDNGIYHVKLHFAEIQFSDEELYCRTARRIFDVYVQGVQVLKDFNIREEAKGAYRPIVKELNATVADHTLEVRLYWAGKGTTHIPNRGNYGPLISAISFCHSSEPRCGAEKAKRDHSPQIIGAAGAFLCVIFLAFGIYTRRRCVHQNTREIDLRAQVLQTVCFTWRQLQAATSNFDESNKLGEGGFGSVFKGELADGTIIAVKQLSSKSCQGDREFVNEIGMISGLHHPNLVTLYGCCVEKNQLLLVYEYMENNSLAHALFGKSMLKLDWETRQKICVGIARGIEYLHEGSMIRMVHRDIKTTNVLLDGDLNAKISDFGLARLRNEEQSHISTKVAGTIGYMAPEYALRGQLTEKADVYSFGVVALEIVSGENNLKCKGGIEQTSLIDQVVMLQQNGNLLEMVDPKLEDDFNHEEAERMIKVALSCINSSPSLRPTMSEAVKMLGGEMKITESISDTHLYGGVINFPRLRVSSSMLGTEISSSGQATTTSISGYELYPFAPESAILDSSYTSS
ncbi:PREDICTED: probable LRR receptor-like serine/threonine-protein kinase At1g29720 [Tarenaya hassleriana]|uniref:probable LRR receptor-like serine/threonine-protein kinase At1g29720 n=1 Tax=Tarenaya hassleriana TaxID=28532 RepID=UPI00053C81CB|nr:PREDICTED: probable LRR receptor-like serine/threonine-protein kinase At1g29720 [Tarenaya hassleriana]